MKKLVLVSVFFLMSVFSLMNVSCVRNQINEDPIEQVSFFSDYNELINNKDYVIGDFTETFLCTTIYGVFYDNNSETPVRYEKAVDFTGPSKFTIKFIEKHSNDFPTLTVYDGKHFFDWPGTVIEKRIIDNYIVYLQYDLLHYNDEVVFPDIAYVISKDNKIGFVLYLHIEE